MRKWLGVKGQWSDGMALTDVDDSLYTGISNHGRDDFCMDSTSSEASEKEFSPIVGSPTNCDEEWARQLAPLDIVL